MKLGMNLFLWTTSMDESMLPVLQSIKEMGYDGVEVPIFDLNSSQWQRWGNRLDELQLERVAVTLCGAEVNPISLDASVRKKALERNCLAVECAQALGATLLTGPFHSALGVFTGQAATATEWNYSVAHTRQMAEKAQACGITLGMEYLNRFENYLLTCTEDTIRYVRAVDHPSCRMMFDTFHANIEEKSLGDAIRSCGDLLVHVQISENDRSTPGHGNINWPDVFSALRDIGYEGWLSVEAFGLNPPDLASAAHIYRRMFDSEQQLASDALTFLRKHVVLSSY